MPACKAGLYTFEDVPSVVDDYDHAPGREYAWESYGIVKQGTNDTVQPTVANGEIGALLASNFYVWYGRVTANLTTTPGRGILTTFSLLSNTGDEAGLHVKGVDPGTIHFDAFSSSMMKGGCKYYALTIAFVTNQTAPEDGSGEVSHNIAATDNSYHVYTIDWSADAIIWSVDQQEQSRLSHADTWNPSTQRYDYPQTPARVQIGVMDAGRQTNSPELFSYSGGPTDYEAGDKWERGYFIRIADVTVECYGDSRFPEEGRNVAYVYEDNGQSNSTPNVTLAEVVGDEMFMVDFCGSGLGPSGLESCYSAPGFSFAMFGAYGKKSMEDTKPSDNDSDTTLTDEPTSVSSSSDPADPTSTPRDYDRGLSDAEYVARQAGIGVGVSLGVLLLLLVGCVVRIRRKAKQDRRPHDSSRSPVEEIPVPQYQPPPAYEEHDPSLNNLGGRTSISGGEDAVGAR